MISRRQALLSLGTALALWPVRIPRLIPGAWAVVTLGPSRGAVVRLEHQFQWTPGTSSCAIFKLRNIHQTEMGLPQGGPVWVVSEFLNWDVPELRYQGRRAIPVLTRYRLTLAPWTGLRPI